MPSRVRPMLCTLTSAPFQDPHYLYEIKWDGYRLIAYKSGDVVRLESRNNLDLTRKYPSVADSVRDLENDVILDGEVVVLDRNGKPDFDALQKVNGHRQNVFFYAFDLLWIDGKDIAGLPLVERKKILETVVAGSNVIRYSDHFDDGPELFAKAKSLGLEGIIAKRRESKYIQNKRGKEWYKIPTAIKKEFVIGGWVESQRGRVFRTLLFGLYEKGKLMWIGHAGTGYKDREMAPILERLRSIEVAESPFVNEVDYEGKVHWVKPLLVADIKFSTTTSSGRIRKPAIFLGFRPDKSPEEAVHEIPAQKTTMETSTASNWPIVEAEEITSKDVLDLGDCTIEVHNVEKRVWKDTTKADLLLYYNSVAPFMLHHLKDRPLTLYLKLKGPNAPGIYIKDMEGREPECADIFSTQRLHPKAGKRNVIDYLVCNNKATLLYTINLGCIDVNPWTSRIKSPHSPDFIVIDLDPSDNDFQKAVETALAAKEVFDQTGLKVFAKTSGKTGIHIFVPCVGFTFPEARRIAEHLCKDIHLLVPSITTTNVSVEKRGSNLFLDANQNDYADTVACVYSVRPSRLPGVSTPFEWKELKKGFSADAFTMGQVLQRLEKHGDLWSNLYDTGVANSNRKKLKRLL
jgi:bifunctional non-homologous end joining protein LigD